MTLESKIEAYKVSLDVFEGPLDLLLYLIKRDEIDIYDISIEHITRQYLEFTGNLSDLDIDHASEFILMAANLMYLKSRSLLPKDDHLPEDEDNESDPRWLLIRQLVEYKKFKDAAEFLSEKELLQQDYYPLRTYKIDLPKGEQTPPPLTEASTYDLVHAFQKALSRYHDKHDVGHIIDDPFTVSEKIDWLRAKLPLQGKISFSALLPATASRAEAITTFLAILELIKRGKLRAHLDAEHDGFSIQRMS